MTKMEFDLTEEQIGKIKKLEEHGISVGEAIDLLFEVKDEVLNQMDNVDENLDLLSKIKDTSMDADKKIDMLEKNFSDSEKTTDMRIQEVKSKINWGREVFKF